MVKNLNKISLCLFVLMLTACSGSTVKQDSDDISRGVPFLDIDAAVVKDFNQAVSLMQTGDNALAVTILKTVVEREKRLPAPFVNLAMAYNKLDEKQLAEENLIEALKLDIGHSEANNELALLYRKAGKFNAARTAYENALRANPDFLPVKKNLGILCDLYLHDFDCAYEQFRTYLDARPNDKTMEIWTADVKRRADK